MGYRMENKYYKGFNRDGFIEWLEDKYGLNSFTVELLDNIIDYAHKHEHVSKDQFAYFISDLVPEIEFMDVAKFCEDTILTRDTLRQLEKIKQLKRLTDDRFVGDGFYQPKSKEERKEIQDMYKPSYKEIYDRLAEYERRFSNG